MKIGYVKNDYPEKRCIIEQVFGEGEYAQVLIKKEDNAVKRFCLRAINHFKYKLGIKNKPEWNKTAVMKKHRIKNVDILHVFNTVCDVKIPWCTTFESETPVTSALVGREWEIDPIHKSYNIDRFSRRMLTLCARDNCRALIALSSSAYNIQKELIERINISKELKDRLRNKLVVLHPPQEILIDRKAFEDKFNNMECVRMVFVGHDFFRKGGDIILTVLKTLAPNYNFKITIVSKLNYGDYASLSTEEDYRKCKQLLDECPWIEYYEALPNKKVLDIIKQAHIGLLPSLSETYGYSVLEMQASGCACVTTNIRALGEINNDNCGWICDIHPNEFGESIYSCYSKEQKRAVHLQLQAELKKVFKNILSNPAGIEEKAYNALERIKCYHDPVRYSKCLEDIYKR